MEPPLLTCSANQICGLVPFPAPAFAVTGTAASISTTAATLGTGTFFTRPRDIHGQRTALHIFAIEHFDRLVCFLGSRQFHKCETTGFPGEFIEHQVYRCNIPCLREHVLNVLFHRLVREVTNE